MKTLTRVLNAYFAVLREQLHVAHNVESLLGSRQGDANAILSFQKTYAPSGIVSYQREQNNSTFFALIIINRGNPHIFKQTLEMLTLIVQSNNLARVGG